MILVEKWRVPQCRAFLAGTFIALDFSTESFPYGLELTWKEYRGICINFPVDVECIEKDGHYEQENCIKEQRENQTVRGPP